MTHSNKSAVTLSIRVACEAKDQLEDLAQATGRTKSYLAAEAIQYYLETQAWQIKGIEQAVEKANSKKAKFFSHEEISKWLNSWGTDTELKPPK